ncbi:head-tail connector protein [Yoonia sp. 208BN28-4]|uniref:head-tail connector protein n=1 Tax=Yoonia sp. 208BN28-4 TaxID=3126505 RepID=UPI00309BEDCC
MILVEETTVPLSALPLAVFKDHLRLGSGFADDTLQDDALETCLRSALAAIEARTCKVLFARDFLWTLSQWRDQTRQPLPVAPVEDVVTVTLVDRQGSETDWPAEFWMLERDGQRPHLCAERRGLPSVPNGGAVRIRIIAGFAQDWSGIPDDLARAVLLLAAHFYEFRYDSGGSASQFPQIVDSLIAPHRTVRLLGGRRA